MSAIPSSAASMVLISLLLFPPITIALLEGLG